MAVTTARRDSTTIAQDVYDIGKVWVFRFTAQGQEGGEVRVTRADWPAVDGISAYPSRSACSCTRRVPRSRPKVDK